MTSKSCVKRSVLYQAIRKPYLHLRNFHLNLGRVKSDKIDSIYVINLDKRPDRMTQLRYNFRKCSIPIERVQAVYGAEFSDQYQVMYAPKAKTVMSKGQIACIQSHQRSWQQMLDGGKQVAWIVEDDALLKYLYARNVDPWLREIEEIDPDWEIIYSYKSTVDHFYDVASINGVLPHVGHSKRHYDKPHTKHSVICGPGTCMAGYLISRKGAKKLLELTKEIHYPLDVQIPLAHQEIRMYAFKPMLSYYFEDGISDSAK